MTSSPRCSSCSPSIPGRRPAELARSERRPSRAPTGAPSRRDANPAQRTDPDPMADLVQERPADLTRLLRTLAQDPLDVLGRCDQPLVLGAGVGEVPVDVLEQDLLHLAPADPFGVALPDRGRLRRRRERTVDREEGALVR